MKNIGLRIVSVHRNGAKYYAIEANNQIQEYTLTTSAWNIMSLYCQICIDTNVYKLN